MTDAERLAEVRRRVIRDFWNGTGSDALHWRACGLCDWIWPEGEAETHEPGCPMEKEVPDD